MSADHRAEALRRAAQAKRATATSRAEAGLRKLVKANEVITFRAVAVAGGVSVDFLYRHPELRRRVEQLRARQQRHRPTEPQPEATGSASVVAALTARLAEARRELAEVKAQLAIAHGELLTLRRRGDTADLHPDQHVPRSRTLAGGTRRSPSLIGPC